MNVLNRHYIHPNLRFEFHEKMVTANELLKLVDRWHSVFDHLGLTKGDAISVNDYQSIEHTSLFIAAAERGLVYVATPRFELLTTPSSGFDPHKLNIKFLFEAENQPKAVWDIPKFNMLKLYEYAPSSNPLVFSTEDDVLLLSKTSGTTGEPKVFYHTHKSLTTCANAAASEFYNEKDKVLLFHTFNHTGLISIQLLPVMKAGCYVISGSGRPTSETLSLILDKRPNKTVMFWNMILHTLKQHPRWPDCDLSFLDEVITGGSKLNKHEIVQTLLIEKGVKNVINAYGLSETPPPVSYERLNKDNYEDFFIDGCPSVGELLPHWQMKIANDGILLLKGDGLALGEAISPQIDEDGFLATKDVVFMHDNKIYVTGRQDRTTRIDDVLVNLTLLQGSIVAYSMTTETFIPNAFAFEKDGKLYVALTLTGNGKVSASAKFNFTAMNSYLMKELGPIYKLSGYCFTTAVMGGEQIKEVVDVKDLTILTE